LEELISQAVAALAAREEAAPNRGRAPQQRLPGRQDRRE